MKSHHEMAKARKVENRGGASSVEFHPGFSFGVSYFRPFVMTSDGRMVDGKALLFPTYVRLAAFCSLRPTNPIPPHKTHHFFGQIVDIGGIFCILGFVFQ